jgi:hypothetical protein
MWYFPPRKAKKFPNHAKGCRYKGVKKTWKFESTERRAIDKAEKKNQGILDFHIMVGSKLSGLFVCRKRDFRHYLKVSNFPRGSFCDNMVWEACGQGEI